MFTGDRSGDFLYRALHENGLSSSAISHRRDDGLTLTGVRISAIVHCAPPANKPTADERDACLPYLGRELALLPRRPGDPRPRGVRLGRRAPRAGRARPGHPATATAVRARRGGADRAVRWSSAHSTPASRTPSPGRLTPEMLRTVLARALDLPPARLPYPSRSNGQRTRLLRDPRGQARGQRRRDQAVVPAAGPEVASGRQHRRRRGRAVQGAQRGLPGAVRSGQEAGLRPVRTGGRRRGWRRARGRGLRRLRRHLRCLLRRRRRGPRPPIRTARRGRPPLRPADHLQPRRSRGPTRRSSSARSIAVPRARVPAPSRARRARPARNATAAASCAPSATRCSARWST